MICTSINQTRSLSDLEIAARIAGGIPIDLEAGIAEQDGRRHGGSWPRQPRTRARASGLITLLTRGREHMPRAHPCLQRSCLFSSQRVSDSTRHGEIWHTGPCNASVGHWNFSEGSCRCPYHACTREFTSIRSMVMHVAARHPRVDGRPLNSVVYCPVRAYRQRFPDMEALIHHIFAVHNEEARVIHLDACGSREYMRDEDEDPPPTACRGREYQRTRSKTYTISNRQQSNRQQRNPTRNKNTRAMQRSDWE